MLCFSISGKKFYFDLTSINTASHQLSGFSLVNFLDGVGLLVALLPRKPFTFKFFFESTLININLGMSKCFCCSTPFMRWQLKERSHTAKDICQLVHVLIRCSHAMYSLLLESAITRVLCFTPQGLVYIQVCTRYWIVVFVRTVIYMTVCSHNSSLSAKRNWSS